MRYFFFFLNGRPSNPLPRPPFIAPVNAEISFIISFFLLNNFSLLFVFPALEMNAVYIYSPEKQTIKLRQNLNSFADRAFRD